MNTLPRLRDLVLAGIVGECAFEAYAWLVSPVLFGVALAPANLVAALSKIYLGLEISYWTGFAIHLIVGAVMFPLIVLLVHKITRLGWVISGAIAGLGLWFTAQGILAPLVGRSFMMGFGTYTQSSFIAHIGMLAVIGFTLKKLENPGFGQSAQTP